MLIWFACISRPASTKFIILVHKTHWISKQIVNTSESFQNGQGIQFQLAPHTQFICEDIVQGVVSQEYQFSDKALYWKYSLYPQDAS